MLPVIAGFTLGSLSLLCIAVLKQHGNLAVGRAFAGLLFVTAAFVVHPLIPASHQFITQIMQTAVPACFWLVCVLAFSERTSLNRGLLLIAMISVFFPMLHTLSSLDSGPMDSLAILLKTVPSYLEYVLIFSGLWVVLRHWSEDLVETRRRLRLFISVFMGITVLVNVVFVNFDVVGEVFQRLLVVSCVLGTGYFLITIPGGILFGDVSEQKIEGSIGKSETELSDVERLTQLMSDGFFTQEKLTIAKLAQKLSMPEYKLRQLINEQLGYRNFNDYLNHYRIEAAMLQLRNEPEKPIMNVALDLGYRTLSSFNRAFKDRTLQTPTQFRQNAENS